MNLPSFDLHGLQGISTPRKLVIVGIVLAAIVGVFYSTVVVPQREQIDALQAEVSKVDGDIQGTTIKMQHLDEIIVANKQLEAELAKKKERLPPEEEAVTFLKQLSDVGVSLGLDIKLWKPGTPSEDPSKLFVRIPVSVQVTGGYNTAAVFFDRMSKLPAIMNVSDLRMGPAKLEQEHALIQTAFELAAFVAPPEMKTVAVR